MLKRVRNSHIFARDEDNWYVEPAWCVQRLFEAEPFPGRVVDPCAGMGRVIDGGKAAGVVVEGYELKHRGHPEVKGGLDFLQKIPPHAHGIFPCDCIVSNPPYGQIPRDKQWLDKVRRLEERFLKLAMARARLKVALFLPASWRVARPWLPDAGLYRIYDLTPRPDVKPGKILTGEAMDAGDKGKTDYSWYVFLHGYRGPVTNHWLHRDA